MLLGVFRFPCSQLVYDPSQTPHLPTCQVWHLSYSRYDNTEGPYSYQHGHVIDLEIGISQDNPLCVIFGANPIQL